MLAEALKTPARSSDLVPTVVIGGLLVALSVLFPAVVVAAAVQATPIALVALPVAVLPGLVFVGYELRVAGAGARAEPAVPSFVNWGRLTRGGLGAVVLTGWYLLPLVAIVVAGLAALTGFLGDAGTIPRSMPAASASALATVGLGALYVAVFAYVWPAAMVTYGATERLLSAMNPARIAGVAFSSRYLAGWLAAAVVLAVPGVIALALSSVLLGLPLLFYVLAAVASLFGRAGGRQLGVEPAGDAGSDDEPAREPEPTTADGEAPDATRTDREADGAVAGTSGADGPSADSVDPTASDVSDPTVAAGANGANGANGATADVDAGGSSGIEFGSDGRTDGEFERPDDGIEFGPDAGTSPPGVDGADGDGTTDDPGTVDREPASTVGETAGEPTDGSADEDGPARLDGYELADEAAVSDRIRDPSDALASFAVDDGADEPEGAAESGGTTEPVASGDATGADRDGTGADRDGTGGEATDAAAGADGDVAAGTDGDGEAADADGDADLGSTPLGTTDGSDDDESDGDGFEWGRVDGSS